MEKIKKLVTVLAASLGISFLGGLLGWNLSDNFNIFLGAVDMICVVWLVVLAYKRPAGRLKFNKKLIKRL